MTDESDLLKAMLGREKEKIPQVKHTELLGVYRDGVELFDQELKDISPDTSATYAEGLEARIASGSAPDFLQPLSEVYQAYGKPDKDADSFKAIKPILDAGLRAECLINIHNASSLEEGRDRIDMLTKPVSDQLKTKDARAKRAPILAVDMGAATAANLFVDTAVEEEHLGIKHRQSLEKGRKADADQLVERRKTLISASEAVKNSLEHHATGIARFRMQQRGKGGDVNTPLGEGVMLHDYAQRFIGYTRQRINPRPGDKSQMVKSNKDYKNWYNAGLITTKNPPSKLEKRVAKLVDRRVGVGMKWREQGFSAEALWATGLGAVATMGGVMINLPPLMTGAVTATAADAPRTLTHLAHMHAGKRETEKQKKDFSLVENKQAHFEGGFKPFDDTVTAFETWANTIKDPSQPSIDPVTQGVSADVYKSITILIEENNERDAALLSVPVNKITGNPRELTEEDKQVPWVADRLDPGEENPYTILDNQNVQAKHPAAKKRVKEIEKAGPKENNPFKKLPTWLAIGALGVGSFFVGTTVAKGFEGPQQDRHEETTPDQLPQIPATDPETGQVRNPDSAADQTQELLEQILDDE